MTQRKAVPRYGRAATVVVVGLYGVAVGAAAGVWFSKRYLQPRARPAPAAGPVAVVPSSVPVPSQPPKTPSLQPDAKRVASIEPVGFDQTETPALPTRPAGSQPAARRQLDPEIDRPAAAASRPRQRARETLYTCTDARHLDATTARPGVCRTCERPLALASKVPHALQAMSWYAERDRVVAVTATQSAQPSAASRPVVAWSKRTARPRAILYTCRRRDHVAATSDRPGSCGLCRADLVRAEDVPHGLEAIRHYAREQERFRSVPTSNRPALFTCPTAQHAHVTDTRPGNCPECALVMLPVERVAHEARAVRDWQKVQRPTLAAQGEPRAPAPRSIELYTCPELAHVDVTTHHPGPCPRCTLHMRSVDEVIHTAEAIEAFVEKLRAERARRAAAP